MDFGEESEENGSPELTESSATAVFYGAYEVKRVLGSGLSSTVRECIKKGTGQYFAVKIIDVSTERWSRQDAERLRSEAIQEVTLLRQLTNHDSIIKMHDFYQAPSFLFTIFEMAPVGELHEVLSRSGTFSEKKSRKLMRQLFDGVAFIHDRRIVHRDLKLENILCTGEERVVISDFGFAVQVQPGQKLKELVGTPGYFAPETLRCQMYEDCEGYGLEVDNWALGVILYTLLAGRAPFYHRRILRMFRMIQEARYEFQDAQWAHITDEAICLIRRLLVIDVNERYTAASCLEHPWITGVSKEIAVEAIKKRNFKRIWRRAFTLVLFFVRLAKFKYLEVLTGRKELRQRPFRDRNIRRESESTAFSVYGHWADCGYYSSRDFLFANRPRPKYKNSERSGTRAIGA